MRKRAAQSGFTLLEVLVVVTIISVMAGAALLSMSGNSVRRVQAEAERLQQIMQMAADEAIFQKMEMGMQLTSHSYSFMQYDAVSRSWKKLTEKPFRAYDVPEDITLSLTENKKTLPLTATHDQPALVFLSNGEMTAFTLSLSAPSSPAALLVADGIAPISLQSDANP